VSLTFPVLASVVLLLLGVVFVPPFLLGLRAEKAFNERFATIANRNGLQLLRGNFERGWFSSKAEMLLAVSGAPVAISAQHNLEHGPFRYTRWLDGDFDFNLIQAQIETRGEVKLSGNNANAPAGVLAFSMDTTIDVDGNGHSQLASPAITSQGDAGKLEWRGLQGDIHFDAGARHVRTELRAPGLSYAAGDIKNLSFSTDLREGIAGHYLGKSRFAIESVAFEPLLQMKKLQLGADTAADGDNLNVGIFYDIADMRVAENQYGPGRLALEFHKLDAAVLARFQEEIKALQRSGRPAEQLGLMQAGKLLQLIGELAKKAPEMEITELRFHLGDNEVSGNARFVLDGSKTNLAENPLRILTALAGEMSVWLPPALLKPMLLPLLQADLESYQRRGLLKKEELAKLTPQHLSAILDQTLPQYLARHEFTRQLVPEGSRFRLNASLRRGQVLVNGEPLGLPIAGMLLPSSR